MKEVLLTFTYVVGAGELFLAAYFWKTNSGNEIRKVMALFSLSIGIWVLSSGLVSYRYPGPFVDFMLIPVYTSGMLIVFSLLHLALIFPYPVFRMEKLTKIFLYFPVFIFAYIASTTNTIVQGTIGTPKDPGNVIAGPLHGVYDNINIVVYLISLIILFSRIPNVDGIHKKMLKIFSWSVLFGGLPAVVIDLIIPAYFSQVTNTNSLIANAATGIWLCVTTYIVSKR